MSKIFPVSFISDGRYWLAGEPIPDADIRPFMLKYRGAVVEKKVVNINRKANQPYYVNNENEMTSPVVRREIAQMEIENEQQELDEQEANEPPNEAVAEAIAELQEQHAADIEKQKLNAQIAAERQDELDLALQEEATAQAEAGEFDEYDVPFKPPPAKVVGSFKVSTPKPKWQYVKRGSVFRRVKDRTVRLKIGEPVYVRNGSDYEQIGVYSTKGEMR